MWVLKKDCQLVHILHHPYDLIHKCKQSLQKVWINLFCHLWVNCIWSTNLILRAAFCVLVLRICQILYRITSYSYPQDCWLTFNLDWLLHATLRFYYCLFNILFLRNFNLLRIWPCYHILPCQVSHFQDPPQPMLNCIWCQLSSFSSMNSSPQCNGYLYIHSYFFTSLKIQFFKIFIGQCFYNRILFTVQLYHYMVG